MRGIIAYAGYVPYRRLDRAAIAALLGDAPRKGTIAAVAAGVRTGLPGGADEAGGGDGAAALIVGDDSDAPVVAAHVASASVNEEFLDRWRVPGERSTRRWEERFGETRYLELGT